MIHYFNKKRAEAGFTLIELLVVIAIIGVLSSIVLASLNNARQKSRDVRRISDLKQIQLALELYFDANNKYPQASATCDASTDYGLQALKGTQIPQVPHDPSSNTTCYMYATLTSESTSPTKYHLGARLEDTKNNALLSDADFDGTATYINPFNGTSAGVAAGCNTATGVAAGLENSTERCYDVQP